MEVAKLFWDAGPGSYKVIRGTDGKYYKFYAVPYRDITEEDLIPIDDYQEVGARAADAEEYTYFLYGMTKQDGDYRYRVASNTAMFRK